MQNNHKKLVLFDFDGVLINTLPMSYELSLVTNPDLTYEDYQKMSHGNFYDAFQGEGAPMKYIGNPNYHADYRNRVREFDTPLSIQEAVRNFSKKYAVAIISSGSEEAIAHFLEKEDLLKCFNDILGYETHKSKVVKIKTLLEKYLISPSDAILVTDTLGDIREATEANVKSIGVTWGLHDRETLAKGNPAAIIDDPANLEDTVESLLKG
jgi:phosphoglycolate phosphatase